MHLRYASDRRQTGPRAAAAPATEGTAAVTAGPGAVTAEATAVSAGARAVTAEATAVSAGARAVTATLAVLTMALVLAGCTRSAGPDAPLFPELLSGQAVAVELTSSDGVISLTHDDDGWSTSLPDGTGRVDARAVEELIATLALAVRGDIIADGGEQLATLGFGDGRAGRLIITSTEGMLVNTRIGNAAPGESRVFLMPAEQRDVFLSPAGLGRILSRPVDDWRDRMVMSFRLPDVVGVELINAGERMVLAPVDGRWCMTQPVEQDVHKGYVDALLFSIAEFEAVGFVNGVTPSECGFGERRGGRASVTVRLSSGPPQSVMFGSECEGGWCAMRPDRDDIYIVPRETVESLFGDDDAGTSER